MVSILYYQSINDENKAGSGIFTLNRICPPPLGIIDVKGEETQPLRQSFQKLSSYIHTADESPDQIRTQIHTGTVGVRIR